MDYSLFEDVASRKRKSIWGDIYKRPDEHLGDIGRGLLEQYNKLGPSWLERAKTESDKDAAAFQEGGVPAMLKRDPSESVDLAGAFGVDNIPGISLATRGSKLPRVPEVFHGSGSPAEYVRPNLPPPTHDLGIHASVNPNIPIDYAYKHVNEYPLNFFEGYNNYDASHPVDFMSGKRFDDPDVAWPRIKPYLLDTKNALQFPDDAIKWNHPESVVSTLARHMRQGYVAPRGLLSDMYNISGSDKMWQDQFIPMLKDKGYDSLYYPHWDSVASKNKYNSFMGFDSEQFIPRYSKEAEQLIKERGIKSAIKDVKDYEPYEGKFETLGGWTIPRGVLKKPDEIESLVRLPRKNTVNWWDDPESSISKMMAAEKTKQDAVAKQYNQWVQNKQKNNPNSPTYGFSEEAMQKVLDLNELAAKTNMPTAEYNKLFDELKNSKSYGPPPSDTTLGMIKWKQDELKDLLNKGKIKFSEFDTKYQELEAKKDQHYGEMIANKSNAAKSDILDDYFDENSYGHQHAKPEGILDTKAPIPKTPTLASAIKSSLSPEALDKIVEMQKQMAKMKFKK